jgi:Lanthionine synthetase C-like protein
VQFDPQTLWPAHPREQEEGEAPLPNPMLYNGAAGVIWALERLRRQGYATFDCDFASTVVGLDGHSAAWSTANQAAPASYFLGASGVRMLQWSLRPTDATAEALYALVEGNLRNPTREALWGSPGSLVAALHMVEATGDARWKALFRHGVAILWDEMQPVRHGSSPDREVFVWVQDLYGNSVTYLGAGHGFAGNLFPVLRGARFLDAALVAAFEARAVETLGLVARRDGPLLNWEPHFDWVANGRPRRLMVQDCHGAPGMVCRLAGAQSPQLQAMLLDAGELIWAAGPLAKRPGLCHGTDGNGYAFLKLHAMTGDTRWLGRARAFAMHALQQSDALAAVHGRRVPSLWTGDAGLAVYLAACIDADPALPVLDVF